MNISTTKYQKVFFYSLNVILCRKKYKLQKIQIMDSPNIPYSIMQAEQNIFKTQRQQDISQLDSGRTETTEKYQKFRSLKNQPQPNDDLNQQLKIQKDTVDRICDKQYDKQGSSIIQAQEDKLSPESLQLIFQQVYADIAHLQKDSCEYIAKAFLLQQIKKYLPDKLRKFQLKVNLKQFLQRLSQYQYEQTIIKKLERAIKLKQFSEEKINIFSQVSQSIEILNLAEIIRYKNNKSSDQLKQKDTIMLIGKSGVGKTTFFLYCLGVKLKEGKIDQFQPEDPNQVSGSQISSKTVSCTRQTKGQKISQDIVRGLQVYIVDNAGFDDNRSSQIDILNNYSTLQTLGSIKSARFAIFISSQMIGDRADILKQFGKTLSRYFVDYRSVQKSIKFILTKFDEASLQKLKNKIEQIIKQINSISQSKSQKTASSNLNFRNFIYHLKSDIKNKKHILFRPHRQTQEDLLQLLMDLTPVQKLYQQIYTSYSMPTIFKIRQKMKYLQSMIEKTLKKRQYRLVEFYLQQLQYLGKIDPKTVGQAYQKKIEWIKDQLSQVSQNYESYLTKFFRNFDKQELSQANYIRDSIQNFKIKGIQISPQKQILGIIRSKILQIGQFFQVATLKQKVIKIDNYFYACLYFLETQDKHLYKKVRQGFQQKQKENKIQFQKQLKYKAPTPERLKQLFYEFMNLFRCNEQNQQYQSRYGQIQRILQGILQKQFQSNKQFLKSAYVQRIDEKTISKIMQSLQKNKIISDVHFKLAGVAKEFTSKILKQLKDLIHFYIVQNKQFAEGKKAQNFSNISIYQENFEDLMEIEIIKIQAEFALMSYKTGMIELLKKNLQNMQKSIKQIYGQINQISKPKEQNSKKQISPATLKSILNEIISSFNFLHQIGKQNEYKADKINRVEQIVKKADEKFFQFIRNIKNKVKNQNVVDFKVNKRLLIIFVIIQQFITFQIGQKVEQQLTQIRQIILQKMNQPLEKQQSRKEKNNQQISAYQYKNLQKLLIYYKSLDKQIEQIQDIRGFIYAEVSHIRKNQKLPQLVQQYFESIKKQFSKLKEIINQFNNFQSQKYKYSKQQKIQQFQQYCRMYYIIKNICSNSDRIAIEAIDKFKGQYLIKLDLKKLIQKSIQKIKIMLGSPEQVVEGMQLNLIEQSFNFFNTLYIIYIEIIQFQKLKQCDNKEKLQQKYYYITQLITERRKYININFQKNLEDINRQIYKKSIDLNIRDIQNLVESVGQTHANKSMLKKFFNSLNDVFSRYLTGLKDRNSNFSRESIQNVKNEREKEYQYNLILLINKKTEFQKYLNKIHQKVPNINFQVDQNLFDQICHQYFQILYRDYQKLLQIIKNIKDIACIAKDLRSLDIKQTKIYNIVPNIYKNYLKLKCIKSSKLSQQIQIRQSEMQYYIKQKYINQKQLIVDEGFTKFYQNTTQQTRQQLEEKLQDIYLTQKNSLNQMLIKDRSQFTVMIKNIQQKKYLFPEKFRMKYKDMIQNFQSKIIQQDTETQKKISSIMENRQLKEMIQLAIQKIKKKDKEALRNVTQILFDYLQGQKNGFKVKKTYDLGSSIQNLSYLKTNEHLKDQGHQISLINQRIKEFQDQLMKNVKTKFNRALKQLQNLTLKFKQTFGINTYKYSRFNKIQTCALNLMQILSIIDFCQQYKEIFQEKFYNEIIKYVKDLIKEKITQYKETNQKILSFVQKIREPSKIQINQLQLKEYLLKASILIYLIEELDLSFSKKEYTKFKQQKQELKQIKNSSSLEKSVQTIIIHIQKYHQQIKQFNLTSIQMRTADASDINKIFMIQQNKFRIIIKLIPLFQNQLLKIKKNFEDQLKNNNIDQLNQLENQVQQSIKKSFQDLEHQSQQQYFFYKNIIASITTCKSGIFGKQNIIKKKIQNIISQKMDLAKKKINQIHSSKLKEYIQETFFSKIQEYKGQKKQKIGQIQDILKYQQNGNIQKLKKKLDYQINNIDPKFGNKKQRQYNLNKEFQSQKFSIKSDISTKREKYIKQESSKIDLKILELDNDWKLWLQQNFIIPLIYYRKNGSLLQQKQTVYQTIKVVFQNIQKRHCKNGKKIIHEIYVSLNNNENNYAQMLKNEGQKFKKFKTRQFKDSTKNQGIQWLVKNIQQIKNNKRAQQQLTNYYKFYIQSKDHIIKQYEIASNQGDDKMIAAKSKFIEQVQHQAKTLKKYLDGGRACTDTKVNLLAKIFSIWIIINGNFNEENKLQFTYDPHPAQICALFFILNIVPIQNSSKYIQNCLCEVPTGQGKSVILAGLSSYFALLGYNVYEACYSQYLSERDYQEFRPLFQALRIKNKIVYKTFSQINQLILNQKKEQNLASKAKSILKNVGLQKNIVKPLTIFSSNQNEKKILIIDQADVLLNKNFIGQVYSPALNIKSSHIQSLLTYIFLAKDRQISPQQVFKSDQFTNVVKQFPQLAQIIKNQVHGMICGAKNFKQDSYILKKGQIFYRENDGLSSSVHHGYKTVFSYFHQHKINHQANPQLYKKNCAINLIYAHLSYSKLCSYFQNIFGVTGTLNSMNNQQKQILKRQFKISKTVTMPSIYGIESKRILKFKKVNRLKRFSAFVNQIQKQYQKFRPILVFFQSKNSLNDFFNSTQFEKFKSKTCKITFEDSPKERDHRIQTATFQSKITLFTDDFSRGTDFKLNMKQKLNHQGVHVIQTYLPASQSDFIQITGRTARQGKKGSATIFKIVNQQEQILQKQIEISDKIALQMIKDAENKYWIEQKDHINKKIQQANKLHDETVELYTGSNLIKDLIKKVYQWNKQPEMNKIVTKTLIALDGTYSMSSSFPKIKQVLKQAFPRLYNTLSKNSFNGAFQLKLVVYRNYNSGFAQIIQQSNFQNKPNILIDFISSINASGGWGHEAIEVCFQKINSIENVDQIIIIGDAAANTPEQTIQKRKQSKQKWTQNSFPQTNITKQTDLLIKKGIPVHSYYIAADNYFKKLSKQTGGKSDKFNVNSNSASEELTNFLSMIILQRIQKQGKGDGSLLKYYSDTYINTKKVRVRHV